MAIVDLPNIIANYRTTLGSKIRENDAALIINRTDDSEGVELNSKYWITIDEGLSTEEHMIVTFTGADGVINKRGLSKTDADTEVEANKHRHDRGAPVKMTNFGLILINRLLKGTDSFNSVDWTGINSIDDIATPAQGDLNKAANVDFVLNTALAGAPDASDLIKGVTKLSLAAAVPANPIAIGDNDPRIPTLDEKSALQGTVGVVGDANRYVTNEDTAEIGAGKILRAKANNFIDQDLVGLTTEGDLLTTNGADFERLPLGTNGQVLKANTTTNRAEWQTVNFVYKDTTSTLYENLLENTVWSVTIPGGMLGTNNMLRYTAYFNTYTYISDERLKVKLYYGGVSAGEESIATGNNSNNIGLEFQTSGYFGNNNATDAQHGFNATTIPWIGQAQVPYYQKSWGNPGVDSTQDQVLHMTIRNTAPQVLPRKFQFLGVVIDLIS